jgi:methylthioribose-1-phosphate isomerase
MISNPVVWTGQVDGKLHLVEQTLLPKEEVLIEIRDIATLCSAIQRLAVRGAPALGLAGAYGLVVAARNLTVTDPAAFLAQVTQCADQIARTRPTAVNLRWAIDLLVESINRSPPFNPTKAIANLFDGARSIQRHVEQTCDAIGNFGEALIHDGDGILTHCNAGPLATGGIGTAFAPMLRAHERGKRIHVYSDETRPLLQGARITMLELMRAGIPATLLCDGAAASLLASGCINCVLVGADRIAANGDVANKVGTYGLALLAAAHGVPFYVAAPSSTIDLNTPSGAQIPIEMRDEIEVTSVLGHPIAVPHARVYNPAFDVTPAHLVTAIITEKGAVRPANDLTLKSLFGEASPKAASSES